MATIRAGIAAFVTDGSMDIREFARMVEDHGFESMWLPEHTHIPVERGGRELAEGYWRLFDQFAGLTAAAAATTTLQLGTCICEVPAHDPISLAKRVATFDVISGGRFEFGIGAGGIPQEIANHGTDPSRRFAVMRERTLAMKETWTKDEPEFHGNYVNFDPILSWPKPVQKPHPPVLMGGDGPRALDRVIEYADGWLPRYPGDVEALAPQLAELQRRGAEAGREYPVSLLAPPPEPAALTRLAELGVSRFIFGAPTTSAADAEKALGPVAKLVGGL